MKDCLLLWPGISVSEGKPVRLAPMSGDSLRKSSASFLSSGFCFRSLTQQGQGSGGSALCGESFPVEGRNACCLAVT